MYRKMIVYNPKTGDFTMYLDGEQVGTIATYGEAVETLNQRMYQLLIAQSKEKANGTDASAESTES